jgi:hypothetical protein
MTTRRAACSCGQLQLTIDGEPSRIAMCHCLECQRLSGAVISNQARFRREQVTFAGKATGWMRTAESGNAVTCNFCPICGSHRSGIVWNEANFKEYIKDPNAKIPGTKKLFGGIKDEQQAADLWAYLRQFDANGNVAN